RNAPGRRTPCSIRPAGRRVRHPESVRTETFLLSPRTAPNPDRIAGELEVSASSTESYDPTDLHLHRVTPLPAAKDTGERHRGKRRDDGPSSSGERNEG